MMDKNSLKKMVENSILDNNINEMFCQLYESIINELNSKIYVIGVAKKLSPDNTPIITVSLKKKRNRPTVFISVNKFGINLKFVCRVFTDIPLNKLNVLIDDCYYHRNESKLCNDYTFDE